MAEIYRPSVPIGACVTMRDGSLRLGLSESSLKYHKYTAPSSFPSPVARIGPSELYVFTELEAFYRSVMWRQADKNIKELMEGGDAA